MTNVYQQSTPGMTSWSVQHLLLHAVGLLLPQTYSFEIIWLSLRLLCHRITLCNKYAVSTNVSKFRSSIMSFKHLHCLFLIKKILWIENGRKLNFRTKNSIVASMHKDWGILQTTFEIWYRSRTMQTLINFSFELKGKHTNSYKRNQILRADNLKL